MSEEDEDLGVSLGSGGAAAGSSDSVQGDETEAQTEVRRSRRAHRAPQAFTYAVKERKAVEADGNGVTLMEVPCIVAKLKKVVARDQALRSIHQLMYSKAGAQRQVKGNILKFNGFSAEVTTVAGFATRLRQRIEKHSLAKLKQIMDILCIDRSGPSFDGKQPTKSMLVQRIAGWLAHPTTDLIVSTTKPSERKNAKTKKTRAKRKASSTKKSPPPKKRSARKKAKKSAAEVEQEDSDSDEEEKEVINAETKTLREAIRKAFTGSDMDNVTVKQIRKKVEAATGIILKQRKAEFSELLEGVIQNLE